MRKMKRIGMAAAAVGMALLLTGCPDSSSTNLTYGIEDYAESSIDACEKYSIIRGRIFRT